MEAARAAFGDGARMLLAGAHDAVGQHGALADYLDVDPRYERAVEAALGDLLQHVVVDDHAQAHAGFALVRGQGAGRCGFIVTGAPARHRFGAAALPAGAVRLSDVVRVSGPFSSSLRVVIGDAVIVPTLEAAAALAATVEVPVVTTDGDVYRGAHVVSGGSRTEARGILATKREIKDLRERVTAAAASLSLLKDEIAGFDTAIAAPRRRCRRRSATPTVTRRRSSRPRPICSAPAPTRRASASGRTSSPPRRAARARRIDRLDARQAEAQASIGRLADERGDARGRPGRRAARASPMPATTPAGLSQRAAEARAEHAGLAERAAGGGRRSRAARGRARDLSERAEACRRDVELMRTQRVRLLEAAVEGQRIMDEGVKALEELRDEVLRADDETLVLKAADRAAGAVDPRRAPRSRRHRVPWPPSSTSRGRPPRPT